MRAVYKTIDELPVTLNAQNIQQVLGISRAMAYNLLRSESFPTLHIGSRKIVPKDAFINWMNQNTGKNSTLF